MTEEFDQKAEKKSGSKFFQNHRQRVLTLILTVVTLIALLLSVTYSWFITSQNPEVPLVEGNSYLPAFLHIGNDRNTILDWDSELKITLEETLSPVCGDGVHFYRQDLYSFDPQDYTRKIKDGDGYSSYGYAPSGDLTELTGEELQDNVFTFDFMLDSLNAGDLFLSSESALSPNLFLSPASPDMQYVSTGYIAGAMRVAIFQKVREDEYSLKCVWIPNPTFEFRSESTDFTPTGEIESSYSFVSPSGTTVISTEGKTNGCDVKNGVLYVWDPGKCDVPFASYTDRSDGYFRVVVWLDGNDRECVNAFAGGKVDLKLGIFIKEEEQGEHESAT